ncbi:hypothetical protein K439DRAFT_1384065 [Ramaria rubella]|nr:hypothetical protein K439DRAFT_1384065 [Ramaria rubella]
MSLKAELETWAAALKAYDEEDFEKSLDLFSGIADSSKILTNMGLIYATLGEHEVAVENFNAATSLDQYLAVAYFQCGVSNFLLTRYELALKDFEEALLYLRGNQAINYEQLGLKFKLYSAEVLFNKGLSQVYLGHEDEGIQDMEEARQEKATDEHNVIDDAIQDRGEGYTVFSIPVGVLYRPSENKMKNARTKDYLGKAKLVAAADSREAYTTFTGVTRLQQGITPTGAPVDRPDTDLTPDRSLARSATTATGNDSASLPKPASKLTRNATTINVVSLQERQVRLQAAEANGDTALAAPLGRSNTMTQVKPMSRGLSVRAPGSSGPAVGRASTQRGPSPPREPPRSQSPPESPKDSGELRVKPSRLTEIYDDYIEGYANEEPEVPPLPTQLGDGDKRVAAWARNNANPAMRRAPSTASAYGRPLSSAYQSSYGGPMQRKLTRRPTYGSRGAGARNTVYEDEEEGYGSGDYDDMPFELIKIRVKLHYEGDVRGMAITPEIPFEEFIERVTKKFGKPSNGLKLKFKDEDGIQVSLRDDSDYDLAIETARESARGKPEGKLEIWCVDS